MTITVADQLAFEALPEDVQALARRVLVEDEDTPGGWCPVCGGGIDGEYEESDVVDAYLQGYEEARDPGAPEECSRATAVRALREADIL